MTHALGLGFTVFTVIFLLELPDKTALAALLLATRHRALPVFLGAAAAFVIQSVVAVVAGSLLSLLPREPIRIGAGILFLGMAALQARYQQPVVVFVAATLALWAVSAIAVALGNRLGAWIPERPLQFAAAGVMVLVAIALITGLLG